MKISDRESADLLLKKFIAIESVSTDKSRHKDLLEAVKFINGYLGNLGFKVKILSEKNCPPLIVASYGMSDRTSYGKKTFSVYAHYDVQPESPVDKWTSPPFKLTLRNGKYFGRGTADDKMHLVQSLLAAKNLIESGDLKNNLIFVFEGEEEVGSLNFETLAKKAAPELSKSDAFFILDMGMKAKNIPQIFYGLRGITGFELTVKIGETDLHSGVYGNRVLNPVQVLADLLVRMKDVRSGKILIPGFYDKVRKIDKKEIGLLSEFVLPEAVQKKNARIYDFIGDFLSSKIYPSLDVNGILSGYTGEGSKTIIPSWAMVKFTVRLVEHQSHDEITRMISEFIKSTLPKQLTYELKIHKGGDPFYTDINNPYTKKTAAILEDIFKSRCYFNRTGGSIAAAEVIQRLFGKPTILTGFTLPDENIHAPDENVDREMFYAGINALEKIFNQ